MDEEPQTQESVKHPLWYQIEVNKSILSKGRLAAKGTCFYIAKLNHLKRGKMTMTINVNTKGISESTEKSVISDLKNDFITHFKL